MGRYPFAARLFDSVMQDDSRGNQEQDGGDPEEGGVGSFLVGPDVFHELQERYVPQEDGISQKAGPVGQMDKRHGNFNSRGMRIFASKHALVMVKAAIRVSGRRKTRNYHP